MSQEPQQPVNQNPYARAYPAQPGQPGQQGYGAPAHQGDRSADVDGAPSGRSSRTQGGYGGVQAGSTPSAQPVASAWGAAPQHAYQEQPEQPSYQGQPQASASQGESAFVAFFRQGDLLATIGLIAAAGGVAIYVLCSIVGWSIPGPTSYTGLGSAEEYARVGQSVAAKTTWQSLAGFGFNVALLGVITLLAGTARGALRSKKV